MTRTAAAIAAATLAGLLGGTGYYLITARATDAFAQCRTSAIGGGAIGGPLSLIDQTGAARTDADIFTRPSLVYFGYTFCPDVCPLDNARNAEAVDILEEMGLDAAPVFISVDRERDTPEVLKDYAEAIHPRMIALTGSPEQVAAASKAYKTYYKINKSDDEFYLVDHTTFTYLVLPGHGFVDFFPRESSADQIAQKAACFINAE